MATATPVTLYFSAAPSGSSYPNPTVIPGSGDIKVLNYALALELLESTLYNQAFARLGDGTGLDGNPVTDAQGNVITGLGVGASDPIYQYVKEFGKVEQEHASFLLTALGGNPYPSNLGFAFGMNGLASSVAVGKLIYTAELAGVGAYLGAIPSFAPKSAYLQVAASIQGTEARHAAAVAIALNLAASTRIETAPLYTENHGIDVATPPDDVLYMGSTGIPGAAVVPGGSALPPVSGANGFVFLVS